MNIQLSNVIEEIIAGIAIFVIGFIFSKLTKSKPWFSNYWKLLLGVAFLVYFLITLFNLTKDFTIVSIVPGIFSSIILMVSFYIDRLYSIPSNIINTVDKEVYRSLNVIELNFLLLEKEKGQSQKVAANVITSCLNIIKKEPRASIFEQALIDLDETIDQLIERDGKIDGYTKTNIKRTLANIPEEYVNEVKKLLNKIS